jgi:carboxymethylenebutenolidase
MSKIPFDNHVVAPVSRRTLLTTSMAAGLSLAARPLLAAVQTDSAGLVAQEVKIPIKGGEISGYCAYPDKGKQFSTILVAHDVFGVNAHMQDIVRRLAKLGYYAICPDLYSRDGDVSKMTDEIDIMRTVVSKVKDADVLSDLDATVAFAHKSGKADVKKLGITGFGWGGRVVWLYAAHDPKLKAGVSWYGFLNAPRDPAGHSAISLASQIKVPVLGLYAGKDDYIMEADAKEMQNQLAGNKKSEIVIFPGVKHGFFADDQKTYDAKTAADGWDRLKVWFYNNDLK